MPIVECQKCLYYWYKRKSIVAEGDKCPFCGSVELKAGRLTKYRREEEE